MKHAALALLCFWLAVSTWAEPVAIRSDSPQQYTVKKGDTLWDIAERFLESPWRWPEIWQANPQTRNPHLIYPGDVISLVEVEGQPRLVVSSAPGRAVDSAVPGRTIKLTPKIRVTPISQAIETIPLHAIRGFMLDSRIVPTRRYLSRAPYIFASDNNQVASTTGDTVYARGRFDQGSGIHDLVRIGEEVRDWGNGRVLGVIGRKVAEARLSRLIDGTATLEILSARWPVKAGDRVVARDNFAPPTIFYPRAPETMVQGRVLRILNGDRKAGKYDTIISNIGERDGIRPGDRLAINASRKVRDPVSKKGVRLPLRTIGTVMIYRTFDKLSYGMVMSATEEIERGDTLSNP